MTRLLLFLCLALPASAATITGSLLDLTGTATDTDLYFRSISTPYASGLNTVVTGSKKVSTSGGTFTVTLLTGDYQVASDRLNGMIRVPAGDGTYNLNSVWGAFTIWGGSGNIVANTSSATLLSTDSGRIITNLGATAAVTNTLPSAAAGLQLTFVIDAAYALRIAAAGTDTIRVGTTVTGAGGYLETNVVGTAVQLIATGTGGWKAISTVGTWSSQ